jgi:hypothetical protein
MVAVLKTRMDVRGSSLWASVSAAWSLAVLLLGSAPVRADVAPPNACTAPGQPCGREAECTCQVSTCNKLAPCSTCRGPGTCMIVAGRGGGGRPSDEDGGVSGAGANPNASCLLSYPCNLCLRPTNISCPTTPVGGRGGAGGAGTGGSSAGTGGAGAGGAGTGGSSAGTGGAGAGTSGHSGGSGGGKHSGCSSVTGDTTGAVIVAFGVLGWLLGRFRRVS